MPTPAEPTAPPAPLPAVTTVGDLTPAHQGWLIRVAEPPDRTLPHRTYVLGEGFKRGPRKGGVRKWSHNGVDWVGLCDATEAGPGIVGTERVYRADTPCSLIRPVTAAAKRAERNRPVQPAQLVRLSVTGVSHAVYASEPDLTMCGRNAAHAMRDGGMPECPRCADYVRSAGLNGRAHPLRVKEPTR